MRNLEENYLDQPDILSQGYGIIPKKVMRDQTLSPESKAIYAYLSSFCGNGNTAFPSISLMCRDLGMGENRFLKHRKSLVDRGYVQIKKKKSEKGFMNNIYTLPHKLYLQNEGMQNEGMQNEGTNNNSFINNNIKKDNISSSEKVPFKKIIDHLNQVVGSRFTTKNSDSQKLIKARWNEGNTLEDFISVIDIKVKQWKDNPEMSKYLRPSTLFSAKNFENYKAEALVEKQKSNMNQRKKTNDFEGLEDLFGDPA